MDDDIPAARWSGHFRRTRDAWSRRSADLEAVFARLAVAPIDAAAVSDALGALRAVEGATLEAALRRLRQVVVLALIDRDSRGAAPLSEVCEAMTAFAEIAVQAALDHADASLAERHGAPLDPEGRPQALVVVGMGKLGARELNVSSDIDLVFVARDQGQTAGNAEGRGAIASVDYLARLAREVTRLLADVTEDGFVFRVDTRLRPDGDAGPLVCTLPMLEGYFYTQGREWERFAWLKSRAIAASGGGLDTADTRADLDLLDQLVRPFVYRRYLDYGAFHALRDLHGRIRAEARKREARRGGAIDVKLGRGGIREIEFIAQLFQVARGGRDPGLRDPATLATLAALPARGLLAADTCAALADAYAWLRRVEHALQYRDDAQTHTLPEDPVAREEVAGLLGVTVETMLARLGEVRALVEGEFDRLLEEPAEKPLPEGRACDESDVAREADGQDEHDDDPGDEEDPADPITGHLAGPGPRGARRVPDPMAERLEGIRATARWRDARPETRDAVDRLALRARRSVRGWPAADRERALARLTDLFERVLGRPGYLGLMDRHPAAFAHVLEMLGRAQWAADYLMRHPIVLDELLDGEVLQPTDWGDWAGSLRTQLLELRLGDGWDVERQMDLLREAHHAQVFRLLAQDLAGRLTVEALSDQLSELADRVLQLSIDVLWPQIRGRHRDTPVFAVIAYGKLGGKELGYASDLDLVYVYEDDDPAAPEAYARLAQRLSGWLSTNTAAGILFEIDTRLRPNGNAGLLVSTLAAFETYQRESAWVWEHQALTRARFAAGDATLGARFETLRRTLLALPRDRERLASEVVAMRQKMHAGHPNSSADFDVKHDHGGMVDVEFSVQYLVLAHGGEHPALLDNAGNIALLARAARAGLVDAEGAALCANAYRRYRKIQHAMRLNDARFVRVPPTDVADERAAVRALWRSLFESGS